MKYLFILMLIASSIYGQIKMTEINDFKQPVKVVQEQLDAYNKQDLEAFLATYADSIKIYNHPNQLTLEGIPALRERYGKLFRENPNNNARLVSRIVQGNFVIDQEYVTGRVNGKELFAIAIYEVKNDKIINVWFIR